MSIEFISFVIFEVILHHLKTLVESLIVGLKPTRALFYVLGKTIYGAFLSLSKKSQISIIFVKLKNQNEKFQLDSNILACPEAGQGNCLTVVLCITPTTPSCKSEG